MTTGSYASWPENAGKLYSRKSEKSGRLNRRRDDDDRNRGKDNFDGTAGSDKGHDTGSDTRPDANAPQDKASSGDTVSALRKKILRTHPGVEMKVERIDYSKAVAYTDSPIYHRLEDYYTLPEGACYVTRGGEISNNISFLLDKLKTAREGEDLTGLLPCYCGL